MPYLDDWPRPRLCVALKQSHEGSSGLPLPDASTSAPTRPARRRLRSGGRAVALLVPLLLLPAGCDGPGAGGEAEAGRRLLSHYQCGRCHRIPGVDAAIGDVAVPLDRFGRRSYIAGRVPNTPDRLAAWLVRPEALVPGTAMPNLGVTDDDARRMARYLGSLQ